MFKCAITNLSNFNSGDYEIYNVSLPCAEEEIANIYKKVGGNTGEIIILDYVWDDEELFDLMEEFGNNENLYELNELADNLDYMRDEDIAHLQAYHFIMGGNLIQNLDYYRDSSFWYKQSYYDVGKELLQNTVPESLMDYINFEYYLTDNDYEETEWGVIRI